MSNFVRTSLPDNVKNKACSVYQWISWELLGTKIRNLHQNWSRGVYFLLENGREILSCIF
jgi:hypothetical protein